MAFDGIITKSVVSELNNILIAIIFWAKPKNFIIMEKIIY